MIDEFVMATAPNIDKIICHFQPLPKTQEFDDVADEYVIEAEPEAMSGLIVWAKYRGEWHHNPFSTRPVIRYLLERIRVLEALEKNK